MTPSEFVRHAKRLRALGATEVVAGEYRVVFPAHATAPVVPKRAPTTALAVMAAKSRLSEAAQAATTPKPKTPDELRREQYARELDIDEAG